MSTVIEQPTTAPARRKGYGTVKAAVHLKVWDASTRDELQKLISNPPPSITESRMFSGKRRGHDYWTITLEWRHTARNQYSTRSDYVARVKRVLLSDSELDGIDFQITDPWRPLPDPADSMSLEDRILRLEKLAGLA